MKKQKRFLNWKGMLVMALVCFVAVPGFAENWTGNKTGRTFTQNTVLDVTGTVTVQGTQVISGCTVTINASNVNRTILRGARDIALFDVRSGGTLIINGGTNKITIDGNGYNNTATNTPTTGDYAYYGYSAILVREGGNARLTDVTMSNHKWTGTGYSVESRPEATHGGAIFVRGNLTCNNCFFSGCSAVQGGAVCVFSGGDATLIGGEVHDCQSTNRGGGVCVINTTNNGGTGHNTPSGSHATLTLRGVKIYNNTSPNGFGGGGYSEFVGANLIVKDNTEIYNNTSKSGGFGVTVADMGDIELRECDIYGNHSTANSDWGGGGLYIGGTVTNDATAYVYEGCKIHDNVARTGGGIYLAANMHLIIEGGEIYNNMTNGYAYNGTGVGGGIYMGDGQRSRASTFEMRGGKIYNNTATERAGGGVYISQGTVTITGGEIYENYAGADGGGIYLNSGSVTMSGGSVYGNIANNSANNGGGLYLAGGDFAMSGTAKMYTNQANNGAGAYLAAGNFTMSGGEMYSNTAATNGGGIYLNNGTPTVSGTAKIYTNTAVNGGGLYLNRGTFNMQGGEVYGNTATTQGGGAYLTANCTYVMTGGSLGKVGEAKNSAPTGGGLYDLGSFSMTDGDIVNNEATTDFGGGAYIQTSAATPLEGGTVAGNTASRNGGGLYITGSSSVTVSGTSFYGNRASNNGGGIYLAGGTSFTLNGGNIGVDSEAKNSAKSGGGVYDMGSFTMNSGNITNNEATSGQGGGAYVNTSSATRLSDGEVSNNTATSHGGGIYITGGSAVTVGGVSIFSNTAGGNGGGVYLSGTGSSFTMTGGAIGTEGHPNTANSGGGAYINAQFSMTGGSISYNNAINGDGGGAYINNTTSVTTITNATISENTANRTANGGNGGGIYLANGSVTVTNATFDHNIAITSGSNNGTGGGVDARGSMTINGTSSFTRNEARLGGAVSITNGTFLMEGGVIGGSSVNANKAGRRGGGVYVAGDRSTVTLQGGEVSYNEAITATDGGGGGIFVNASSAEGTKLTQTSKLNNNKAIIGGGAYINAGNLTIDGTNVQVNNNEATGDGTETMDGSIPSGIFTGDGGGLYIVDGIVTIKGTGVINGNSAGNDGGGIFTKNATSSITVGVSGSSDEFTLSENHAARWGGALRVGGNVTFYTGTLTNNYAQYRGGAIYVAGGDVHMYGGVIGGTTENGNYTIAESNGEYGGGGLYVLGGEVNLNQGSISGNHVGAGTNGGGVYMGFDNTTNTGGVCTIAGGTIGGADATYANSAELGGGIYSAGGTINVTSSAKAVGSVKYNTANKGGGIYSNGDDAEVNITNGNVEWNHATTLGGGIYAQRGWVNFSDGFIRYNKAEELGGGLYVDTEGNMTLKGNANLTRNYVPAGQKGGGIYLLGVIVVGEKESKTLGIIKAEDNFAVDTDDPSTYYPPINPNTGDYNWRKVRNNVYLPDPVAYTYNSGERHVDVITVIEDGLNEASRVGFSVPHNFIPVVFCERSNETGASGYPTNQDYVDRFSTGQAWDVVIFEDRSYYRAVHEYTSAIYDPDHLYLLEFWPEGVAQLVEDDPNPNNTFNQLDDPIIITTDQDMAHFACWVNGSQLFDYVPHPDADAIMEGDVNMDLFSWVPIGPYSGNFNGQGHTITGISSQLYQEHMGYGLFGTVNGGTVENVLLKDAFYQIDNKEGVVIGAIVSEAVGGTEVANCEASAYIGSNHEATIIGGAVGRTGQVTNQTIYDNIDHPATSHSVPVAGANTNEQVKTEFIIPADMLAGMTDATITGLSFRLDETASADWGSARFQIFIKEVTDTQISSFQGTSGATVVYEGPLDASHITMPVTFSTAYGPYQGGNLLVGIYCTTPGTSLNDASFYGKEVMGACVQGTGSNAVQQNFLPWMTFTCGQTQAEETPNVHSVYACVEMQGGLMGGLVGHIVNGSLENSFANPKFNYTGTTQYFGGLVGVNGGTVENCYTRMQGASATEDGAEPASNKFGWFVGQNNTGAVVNYCYNREGSTNYIRYNLGHMNGSGYYANNTEVPYLYQRRDNQVTVDLTEGLNTSTNNVFVPADDKDHQMLLCLNRWVAAQNSAQGDHPTYTEWMRTTSKTINNDLPVLKMPFANSIVGSTSTVYLDYGDINDMMSTYQAVNQALCLYQSKDRMNSNTESGAKLYINEDVSIIPADRADGVINAYVGITIANLAGENGAQPTFGGTDAIDWHMFATPLQAAPLGIDYHGDNTAYHGSMNGYDYYGHYGPYYRFMQGDADGNIGYFPSHTYGQEYPASDATVVNGNYYRDWDFYTYYEPEYHWINFKRNSNDHWHENAHEVQIEFDNGTTLEQGRGYLVAFTDDATFLQCHGDLNTGGDIEIPVTMSGYYSTGYNLLGNPYQAYLDFNEFARYNSDPDEGIWARIEDANYRILDEKTAKDYITYAYGGSENPFGAGRYIHPHQGFMVYSTNSEDAVATFQDVNDADGAHMRAIPENATGYRSAQVNYPLVNLFATEGNGNQTMVTVELGRPDKGGAKLMSELRVGKGQMWCHYDDADWKLAFTRPGVNELPIRFSTIEDTEYTMTWSTHNGEFSYMHLIDNMTGADVDCLAEHEYKFSSKTTDYASRFKLVFDYMGVEENEEEATQNANFAFMMGDELVVNGEGTLQVFDITGRQLMSTLTQGTQTTLHLPQVSTGVYVLRMTSNGQVKTQKMVINQ